ncbi:MAG TPA: hypothetical protein VNU66_04920 [Mycobacteriales bacterium]|nr:hypothetical protein [Mycobacteriales bacterium]
MLIDCDGCAVRELQCGDCVVTVLLGGPPGAERPAAGVVEVDDGARQALDVLADSGLVPRLRLVPREVPAEVLAEARSRSAHGRQRGVS